MVIAALILLAAAQDAAPPPAMNGPAFACRMTDRSGESFLVNGRLGAGRRFNSPTATMRPTWSYRYPAASVEDGQARFSGAPIVATSSPEADDIRIMIRYAAGRDGRRIDIGEGRSARLSVDNTGDVLADGRCRLVFAPRVASSDGGTQR